MKKLLITIAAIGLSSAAFAQAAAVTFTAVDADTSGGVESRRGTGCLA